MDRGTDVAGLLGSDDILDAIVGLEVAPEHLAAAADSPIVRRLRVGGLRVTGGYGAELGPGALATLRELRACLDLEPSGSALHALNRCTEAGAMARLVDLQVWTRAHPEALAASLDHYLTCPTLEVPIEPWHSLARRAASARGADLWGHADETIRRDHWLDDTGRVTLSARYAREERFFGALTDGPGVWESSELWGLLANRRQLLFRERSACAFCAQFPPCGGYGAREGVEPDPAWCEVWIPLLERIERAAAAVRAETAEDEGFPYPG